MSDNFFGTMQLNFSWTYFGKVLQHFCYHAKEFGLGDNSKTSLKKINRVQLNFSWDTIWKCLRIYLLGSIWVSAETHFGNVLQCFWYIAIGKRLGNSLIKFYNNSGTMQLNFCRDTVLKCLRIVSVQCSWFSADTQFENFWK